MKSYTDLEQSKKLAEFLPIESADMEYMFLKRDGSEVSNVPFVKNGFEEPECCYIFTPCWSLVALLELMPFHIIENNNRFGFYQVKGFNKQGETYHFGYKTNKDSFLFETSWYNDVIDAAFEIVVWLKENGKI